MYTDIPASVSTTNLLGFSLAGLEALFEKKGQARFRGRQLYKWIYQRGVSDFSDMTDLSQGLRAELSRDYRISGLKVEKKTLSRDGVIKFLFKLEDGDLIESVLIPDRNTTTACISSQVGCPLACRFCATGTMNLNRNLTAGEIVGQLLAIRDIHGEGAFTNIVFMGMGEPLLNYDQVVKALEIITAAQGLGLSPRRVTISTSGITPKIKRLAELKARYGLAISLHAANQIKREAIMPIAQTFALPGLMDAAREYSKAKNSKITFEYILFEDFNDQPEDVIALVKLTANINCKINLLSYNPVPGLEFHRPGAKIVDRFAAALSRKGVLVTVRQSRGLDIDAACGQLAIRERSQKKTG